MTEGLYERLQGQNNCLAELWLNKVQSWQNFKRQKRSVKMTVLTSTVSTDSLASAVSWTLPLWVIVRLILLLALLFVDDVFSSPIVHDPSICIFQALPGLLQTHELTFINEAKTNINRNQVQGCVCWCSNHVCVGAQIVCLFVLQSLLLRANQPASRNTSGGRRKCVCALLGTHAQLLVVISHIMLS